MQHRRHLALALFLTGACLPGACTRLRGEAQSGKLIFSHAQHVEQAECADCHPGAAQDRGQQPAGRLIPGKAKCGECHEEELKSKCQLCHRGAKQGVRFARANRKLNFSHAAHGKRVEQCATCHPKNMAAEALIPGHATCNTAGCHQKDYQALSCRRCHQQLQQYQLKPIAELSHGPGFVQNHGPQARQAIRACTQCHQQPFCADCHAGKTGAAKGSLLFPEEVERGFIHRGDFLTRHAVEAQASPQTCMKCHGQRHCRSCHALNGLAVPPHQELRGGQNRSFHPAGWATAGGDTFHGHEARVNITRCASCHDRGAQSNCVECHRVGGPGGKPHPPGWSWGDKQGQCRQNRMCVTCHAGGQGCR